MTKTFLRAPPLYVSSIQTVFTSVVAQPHNKRKTIVKALNSLIYLFISDLLCVCPGSSLSLQKHRTSRVNADRFSVVRVGETTYTPAFAIIVDLITCAGSLADIIHDNASHR